MRFGRSRSCATVVTLTLLMGMTPLGCVRPAPPEQPSDGPGSPGTVATEVTTTSSGEGAELVFIYEPANTDLESAPVIVFLHGYGGVNPSLYGVWIKHLVQRGNIVLYPIYQDTLLEPELYTANALAAIQDAYAVLQDGGHILPDDSRWAIVGHSMGGTIAMNLAAIFHENGLPRVRTLMAANAGDVTSANPSLPSIQADNYDQIPEDILFLGIVGEEDDVVGQDVVVDLYSALTQVPSANREMLELRTDIHGIPNLIADHRAPLAVDEAFDAGDLLQVLPGKLLAQLATVARSEEETLDAFDYYGYWKWLDALTDAAFFGTNREYALGNTPEQTNMGTWSDGEPVTPAVRILPAAD